MVRETCWTLIEAMRGGNPTARNDFARRYLSPVRAYLIARWKGGPMIGELEDGVQDVFLRCFAPTGPLDRVERISEQGFRAYLYGICRNVAREYEAKHRAGARSNGNGLDELPGRDAQLSTAFDKAFARQVVREARDNYRARTDAADPAARKRFELLSLRFEENLPIRAIAERWGEDPARVHKEYARARREYRHELLEVIAEQNPGSSAAEVESTAKRLLDLVG